MDEHLARLDRRVAAAVDAWLTDPRDTQVYARLVAAVEARRAYLNPALDQPVPEQDPDDPAPPTAAQDDEVLGRARRRAVPGPPGRRRAARRAKCGCCGGCAGTSDR